jgi:ABC-type microcin C transport system permease subunit YejB
MAAKGSGYKAGRDIDKKQREELKKLYGFDKPAHVRYFEMLADFARFDLGRSFLQNKDVWTLIKEKLPVSISLGLWTFLISYLPSASAGHRQGGAGGHALRHAPPSSCCWATRFRASCSACC